MFLFLFPFPFSFCLLYLEKHLIFQSLVKIFQNKNEVDFRNERISLLLRYERDDIWVRQALPENTDKDIDFIKDILHTNGVRLFCFINIYFLFNVNFPSRETDFVEKTCLLYFHYSKDYNNPADTKTWSRF